MRNSHPVDSSLGECTCCKGAFTRTKSPLRRRVDRLIVDIAQAYYPRSEFSTLHLLVVGSGHWRQVLTTTTELARAGYNVMITAIDTNQYEAYGLDITDDERLYRFYKPEERKQLKADRSQHFMNSEKLSFDQEEGAARLRTFIAALNTLTRSYGKECRLIMQYATPEAYITHHAGVHVRNSPPHIVTLIDDLTELGSWQGDAAPQLTGSAHDYSFGSFHHLLNRICSCMPEFSPLSVVMTEKEPSQISLRGYHVPHAGRFVTVSYDEWFGAYLAERFRAFPAEYKTFAEAMSEGRMGLVVSYCYHYDRGGDFWRETEVTPLIAPVRAVEIEDPATIEDLFSSVRQHLNDYLFSQAVSDQERAIIVSIQALLQSNPHLLELLERIDAARQAYSLGAPDFVLFTGNNTFLCMMQTLADQVSAWIAAHPASCHIA